MFKIGKLAVIVAPVAGLKMKPKVSKMKPKVSAATQAYNEAARKNGGVVKTPKSKGHTVEIPKNVHALRAACEMRSWTVECEGNVVTIRNSDLFKTKSQLHEKAMSLHKVNNDVELPEQFILFPKSWKTVDAETLHELVNGYRTEVPLSKLRMNEIFDFKLITITKAEELIHGDDKLSREYEKLISGNSQASIWCRHRRHLYADEA